MTERRNDIPAAAVLMASGAQELAALDALLQGVRPGESVHGARRRIKQLRSLLRLLRQGVGEESYGAINGALRSAADALAGSRRAEALIAAAAKLELAKTTPGFWQRLAEAHRAAHAAQGDPAQALAQARTAITDAALALSQAGLATGSDESIDDAFLATYLKARRRLRGGLASGLAADLHEARKFVIHHLHHLRLLQPERRGRPAALERLREVLGDLNDLDELETLAAGMAVAEKDARRMAKARARLLSRAEKAAGRLFRDGRKGFAKRQGHAAKPRSRRHGLALQAGE